LFLRLQTYIPTAALAFLIFYFAFSGLTGDKGLLLWAGRRAAPLAEKQAELKTLRAERMALETKVRFLRDDNLSADLLEERAHVLLGFTDPRDYVIRDVRKSG
jgi:cell division protein FtsB